MSSITFTCAGTIFFSKLADFTVTNGWTRCEIPHDWIQPTKERNILMLECHYYDENPPKPCKAIWEMVSK